MKPNLVGSGVSVCSRSRVLLAVARFCDSVRPAEHRSHRIASQKVVHFILPNIAALQVLSKKLAVRFSPTTILIHLWFPSFNQS
jgi:hypothetical protein